MEKKSKKSIVIGITSLFLVMLILVGLTYAYYRTRVIGNESEEPSISVQSKKLEVVYQNESAYLEVLNIEPSNETTYSKTFEVKNNGTEIASYSIIIDEMVNTFERNELDWEYTLTKEGETNPIATDFISAGDHQILVGKVEIPTGATDKYTLTIKYKNQEIDQSEDMGASLSFRINIDEEKVTWDNATEGTLLYAIKKDNIISQPLSKIGDEINLPTEAILSKTNDDYGTTYYYRGAVENNYINFAGMCWRIVRVTGDGNIKIILEDRNALCEESAAATARWDIATDETGNKTSGHFGYQINTEYQPGKNVFIIDFRHSMKQYSSVEPFATALKYFQTTTLADYTDSLVSEVNWCVDDTGYERKTQDILTEAEKIDYYKGQINPNAEAKNQNKFWYGSYVRLDEDGTHKPTLECKGSKYNDWDDEAKTPMYAASLTAEEVAFAGGKFATANENYYLITGFDNLTSKSFWTLSPTVFFAGSSNNVLTNVTQVKSNGQMKSENINTGSSFRPAVVLRSDVLSDGGNGTKTSPYEV